MPDVKTPHVFDNIENLENPVVLSEYINKGLLSYKVNLKENQQNNRVSLTAADGRTVEGDFVDGGFKVSEPA